MLKYLLTFLFFAFVLVEGCSSLPSGPSLLVLPGTGKPYEQFQNDDYLCRQIAMRQVDGHAQQTAASQSAVSGITAGADNAGLANSVEMSNSSSGYVNYDAAQQRFDLVYLQCMYAKGHRVPVWGQFTEKAGGNTQQPTIAPPPNQRPPDDRGTKSGPL